MVTDVVMDAVTIAQVWSSWVGTVMLMVVFVPNLVTTIVLAVCMCRRERERERERESYARRGVRCPPA